MKGLGLVKSKECSFVPTHIIQDITMVLAGAIWLHLWAKTDGDGNFDMGIRDYLSEHFGTSVKKVDRTIAYLMERNLVEMKDGVLKVLDGSDYVPEIKEK